MSRRGDVQQGGEEESCGEKESCEKKESCGEMWQQREQESCGKKEREEAVIRRRGEKESCDKGEMRSKSCGKEESCKSASRDVISRQFSSNYVLNLCIMLIFRFWGVMPNLCFDT